MARKNKKESEDIFDEEESNEVVDLNSEIEKEFIPIDVRIKSSFWCNELNKSFEKGVHTATNAEELEILKRYA